MELVKTMKEVHDVGQIVAGDLINADCLVAMQYIADESIDAIICDLPYG